MFTAWRRRRHCFHHNRATGQSWITSRLINAGMGKMLWCEHCGKTWFA